MNYLEKKALADGYLMKKAGVTWDELGDINSLHEVDTDEDIIAFCDARLDESGFPSFDDETDQPPFDE